jgi:hypothetical protein
MADLATLHSIDTAPRDGSAVFFVVERLAGGRTLCIPVRWLGAWFARGDYGDGEPAMCHVDAEMFLGWIDRPDGVPRHA